jgi:hypothetical protein
MVSLTIKSSARIIKRAAFRASHLMLPGPFARVLAVQKQRPCVCSYHQTIQGILHHVMPCKLVCLLQHSALGIAAYLNVVIR